MNGRPVAISMIAVPRCFGKCERIVVFGTRASLHHLLGILKSQQCVLCGVLNA